MSVSEYRVVALGLVTCLICGCKNPLTPHKSDYAKQIPLERFRDIERTSFNEYLDPEPVEIDNPLAAVAEVRRRFQEKPEVTLSIEQARAAALTNNLNLQVALLDPAISEQSISEAEALFESSFTLTGSYNSFDTATSSDLQDGQGNTTRVTPSFNMPLRTGGELDISLPISRAETNNAFSTLDPSYNTNLRFSLTHSLLRNAGRGVQTAPIRIAGYGAQITEANTRLTVINQLSRVDRVYWQLSRSWRQLEVAEQQYDLAITQLERARRQVTAGAAAEVEIIRAESGVADRIENIIIAQNLVLIFERELKELINEPGLDVDTSTAIRTTTPPIPLEYEFNADALAVQAVDQRMELLELELRLIQDSINIETAENRLLPLLDLNAAYQINGLGGSLDDAFDQLVDNRFEDWSIGGTFSMPIGNEAARSRHRRALLTRMQRLSTREARTQSIRREVYDAVDNIRQAWRRILAARQSVILNTRTFEAEERQFDAEQRTSTDVLIAAANLAEAQFAEARALADYQIAQVDLARATGTLLGAARIRWDPIEYNDIDREYAKSTPPTDAD